MSTAITPFEVPRPVARKVSRLRRLVRIYSALEGLAAVLIVLGVGFWAGLLIDWLLEPGTEIRWLMWLAVGVAALAAAWQYIGRRLVARLPADSLALLVERHYPALDDALVTTVQAGRGGRTGKPDVSMYGPAYGPRLMAVTGSRAAAAMPDIQLSRVFDWRPLRRKAIAAAALLAAVAALALLRSDLFGFWLSRMRMSEQLWPRQVDLAVVGFEAGEASPAVNVARDDEYELVVLASIVSNHVAPDEVEVRWRRPSDGGRGSGPMLRIGQAEPGRDDAQRYRYTFKVSSDLEFDVVGGDDRVRNLRLRAVERPAITRIWLEAEYPPYMQRQPRSIAVSNRAELPEGTRAVCRVECNKPLQSVLVVDADEQTPLRAEVDGDNRRRFGFPLDAAKADRVFLLTMLDTDGVANRDPFRLPLTVIADETPDATVRLRGIGSAVTPQATIPFNGRIRDDYGLEEAWFEYSVDEGDRQRRLLRVQPEGSTELRITEPFDLAETDPETNRPRVPVEPGQKLGLAIRAQDAYDLTEASHVGGTAHFALDIVTPSQLRAILEKRELSLRQRFQAIYEKMVGVRELLDRVDAGAGGSAGEASASSSPQPAAAADAAPSSLERDRSRIGGARQSAAQLAAETGGVASGFDDIVAELINNRVDTEELKERLEQGIAEPLKEISGELLPALEQRLLSLEGIYRENGSEAAKSLTAAKSEADAVVEAMKNVLDRMLELESYNELVELLRGIVEEQQRLRQQTQQQQREKLRSLLEE